jgi:hypothetical protein
MAELGRVSVWAHALIALHLDPSWSFAFDNAKKRAGLCDYTRKRISVSRYLAARWSDDDVHQTLLHEVAHAMAGPAAGHGAAWKRTAESLGYVGGRTHDGPIATELAPWVGTCPRGHVHYRHRKPTRDLSCARCSRAFSREFLISWTRREISPSVRRAAAQAR